MSWDQYIENMLMAKPDPTGKYNPLMKDMLASTGIFSQQGAKCAATGDEPTLEEVKKMVEIVQGRKAGEAVIIKGTKYQQICMWEKEDEIRRAYFKKQEGGLVVAVTNTLIIYGIYDIKKEGIVKGKKKKQNQGDAACLVEELTKYLCDVGS